MNDPHDWTIAQARAAIERAFPDGRSATTTRSRAMSEEPDYIAVVFDGPPSHESGRFVECETPDGRSINVGEWVQRDDWLWELRIPSHTALLAAAREAEELREWQREVAEWFRGELDRSRATEGFLRALLARVKPCHSTTAQEPPA